MWLVETREAAMDDDDGIAEMMVIDWNKAGLKCKRLRQYAH